LELEEIAVDSAGSSGDVGEILTLETPLSTLEVELIDDLSRLDAAAGLLDLAILPKSGLGRISSLNCDNDLAGALRHSSCLLFLTQFEQGIL
jgi:hypothetical protein